MKVLVTGATGLIGRCLCKGLFDAGHQLTIVTRFQKKYDELVGLPATILEHDLTQKPLSTPILPSIEVAIHLAGENIGGSRWTQSFKQKLLASRVLTSQHLMESFRPLSHKKLALVISASGVDIYSPSREPCHEESSSKGTSFLSQICQEWEKTIIDKAKLLKIRSVQARFGVVLSRDSEILRQMEPYVRWGLLGRISGEDFYMSFIHIQDLIRGLIFCIDNPQIQGSVNFTAPEPCLHSQFTDTLNQIFKKKTFFPIPKKLLSILKGEMIDVVTQSHHILPQKLQSFGFAFDFPNIKISLERLYSS